MNIPMRRYFSYLPAWMTAGALLLLGATPSPAATVSGTLGGALSVDQTGSAGYTIPITVPPGTAGMQPSLSLSYNSSGGNGMLGQGWRLQGLSVVSRCPKTKAQDDEHGTIRYNADDRFCLDGQRLVAVRGTYGLSGTEYRTEIDSFVKVVSRGTAGSGPQYWEVWTKSGQKMEYGRSTASRVEATGQASVRQWKLNRVEDTVGNYLTVSYTEDTADGFAYPSRIDYSGHKQGSTVQAPYASVAVQLRGAARRHRADAGWVPGRRRPALDRNQDLRRCDAGVGLPTDLFFHWGALPFETREHQALRRGRRLSARRQLSVEPLGSGSGDSGGGDEPFELLL